MNELKCFALGFYGDSNSGKTNLIVDLIKKLKKLNIEVATIKISNKKIGIDKEGKDTWKHKMAGSLITVFSSPIETDFILNKNLSVLEIIDCITKFQKIKVVIIEGACDPKIPKIRLGRIEKRINTLFTYDGDISKIISLILENIKKL